MKAALLILLSIFFSATGFSQDLLYTTDGKKTEVKILEVKPREIKYKKTSNLDGPYYILPKSKIVLITYANGTFESFSTRAVAKRIDTLATTFGKNLISYNSFDLIVTNVSFSYERILANGILGIRVPIKIGFGDRTQNWYNSNIGSGTVMATGLDLNIYPNKQGRVRYFIAPSFLVTSFNYEYYDNYSSYYTPSETKMGIQYAILVKHGLLIQITPHFNMSYVLGLGISENDTKYDDVTNTKATFEFNVGYRF